jgi:hypothetical protein
MPRAIFYRRDHWYNTGSDLRSRLCLNLVRSGVLRLCQLVVVLSHGAPGGSDWGLISGPICLSAFGFLSSLLVFYERFGSRSRSMLLHSDGSGECLKIRVARLASRDCRIKRLLLEQSQRQLK